MTMTGMNEHFIYQDMPTFRVMYLKKNHVALILLNENGIKYIFHVMLNRFSVETLPAKKDIHTHVRR